MCEMGTDTLDRQDQLPCPCGQVNTCPVLHGHSFTPVATYTAPSQVLQVIPALDPPQFCPFLCGLYMCLVATEHI